MPNFKYPQVGKPSSLTRTLKERVLAKRGHQNNRAWYDETRKNERDEARVKNVKRGGFEEGQGRRDVDDENEVDGLRLPQTMSSAKKATNGKNGPSEAPVSAPVTTVRNRSPKEESDNKFFDDDGSDVDNDEESKVVIESPPSNVPAHICTMEHGKRSGEVNKKTSHGFHHTSKRHTKQDVNVSDGELKVNNHAFEGGDEQGSSSDDQEFQKSRARVLEERNRRHKSGKLKRRRRGHRSRDGNRKEDNTFPSLPTLLLPPQQPQQKPFSLQQKKPRNIAQEYRTRAATLRTRSPTDYLLNGFPTATVRTLEVAGSRRTARDCERGCANSDCAKANSSLLRYDHGLYSVTSSRLPPILTQGIVNRGTSPPISRQVLHDDFVRGNRYNSDTRNKVASTQLPSIFNFNPDRGEMFE